MVMSPLVALQHESCMLGGEDDGYANVLQPLSAATLAKLRSVLDGGGGSQQLRPGSTLAKLPPPPWTADFKKTFLVLRLVAWGLLNLSCFCERTFFCNFFF